MTTHPEKGLFLVNNLRSLGETPQRAYCRIQAAAVYTVPKPARNRLISYKVIYWDEMPSNEEECAAYKQYVCPNTRQVVFLLNKNFVQMTAAEVEMACVKHFLETVLISYQMRRLKDALANLQVNKDDITYRVGSVTGKRLGIWNVLHVHRLESHCGRPIEAVSQTISYRGGVFSDSNEPLTRWKYEENEFITFDSVYEGYTKLMAKAFEHFDNEAVIAGGENHFGK